MGTPIRLHVFLPLAAILAALSTVAAGHPWQSVLLAVLVAGPLLLITVLVHELGHVIAAKRCGCTADHILLWPLGGLAFIGGAVKPKDQGGRVVSLDRVGSRWITVLLFNLLVPCFPLDCSRILASLLLLRGLDPGHAAKIIVICSVIALAGVVFLSVWSFMTSHSSASLNVVLAVWLAAQTWRLHQARVNGQLACDPLFSAVMNTGTSATSAPVHSASAATGRSFQTFQEGATAVGKPSSTPGSSQVCLASAIALVIAISIAEKEMYLRLALTLNRCYWDDREMEAAAPSAGKQAVQFGPVGTPPPDDAQPSWVRDTNIQCGLSCVLSEFKDPPRTDTPVFSAARPPDATREALEVHSEGIQTQASNLSMPHRGSDFVRSISGPLETVDEGECEETSPTQLAEKKAEAAEAKAAQNSAQGYPSQSDASAASSRPDRPQPRASSEKRNRSREPRSPPRSLSPAQPLRTLLPHEQEALYSGLSQAPSSSLAFGRRLQGRRPTPPGSQAFSWSEELSCDHPSARYARKHCAARVLQLWVFMLAAPIAPVAGVKGRHLITAPIEPAKDPRLPLASDAAPWITSRCQQSLCLAGAGVLLHRRWQLQRKRRKAIASASEGTVESTQSQKRSLTCKQRVHSGGYYGFILLSTAVRSFEAGVVASMMPTIRQGLHLTYTSQGNVAGSPDYGIVPSGLLAMAIFKRFSPFSVLTIGYFVIAAVSLGCALLPSFHTLVAARAIGGLCWGLAAVHYPTWVNRYGPTDKRTLWMAGINAMLLTGIVSGYVIGGLARATGMATWESRLDAFAWLVDVGDRKSFIPKELQALGGSGLFLCTLAAGCFQSGSVGFMLYFITQALGAVFHWSPRSIYIAVSLVITVGPIGGILSGAAYLNRVGGYQNYRKANGMTAVCAILSLLCGCCLPFAGQSSAVSCVPEAKHFASATQFAMQNLAKLLIPLLGGVVIDHLGLVKGYHVVTIGALVFYAIAASIIAPIPAGHLHRICDPFAKRARPVWLVNRSSSPRSSEHVRRIKPLPKGFESRPPEAVEPDIRTEVHSVMAQRRAKDWLMADNLQLRHTATEQDFRKRSVAAGAVYYAKPSKSCLQSLGAGGNFPGGRRQSFDTGKCSLGDEKSPQSGGPDLPLNVLMYKLQKRPDQQALGAAEVVHLFHPECRSIAKPDEQVWVAVDIFDLKAQKTEQSQATDADGCSGGGWEETWPAMLQRLARWSSLTCLPRRHSSSLAEDAAWRHLLPPDAKFRIVRHDTDGRGGGSFLFEAQDPQRSSGRPGLELLSRALKVAPEAADKLETAFADALAGCFAQRLEAVTTQDNSIGKQKTRIIFVEGLLVAASCCSNSQNRTYALSHIFKEITQVLFNLVSTCFWVKKTRRRMARERRDV
eukprot:s786_g21.t1